MDLDDSSYVYWHSYSTWHQQIAPLSLIVLLFFFFFCWRRDCLVIVGPFSFRAFFQWKWMVEKKVNWSSTHYPCFPKSSSILELVLLHFVLWSINGTVSSLLHLCCDEILVVLVYWKNRKKKLRNINVVVETLVLWLEGTC